MLAVARNLTISRKPAGTSIPAHLTVLSVSWFNNQFKAVAVHRGKLEGTWENTATEAEPNFEGLLREAVQKTAYRGQTVSLVLAQPRLVQQLADVPPVKGAAFQKVLQRQAQQQKLFPGEAAWAVQASLSNKPSQSVILHLFPKQLLDQLVAGCKRNGLRLIAAIPAAAVLHKQLTDLPLENGETALLAGETGSSVTVVVGRRDGEIFLTRTLAGNWTEGTERLALDLNRTTLFVNQQYSVTVDSGLWLFGRRAADQLATLQRQVQLPIKISPVSHDPFYWATEALKLNPASTPNLISLQEQQAPQRRVFAKVVAISATVLLLLSLTAAVYSSLAARQERAIIRTLTGQLTRLQSQHQALQQRNDQLATKEKTIKLVLESQPPPVPLWLLAYLGQVTPTELVITNLNVKQNNESWNVHLAGTFQPASESTPEGLSRSLALLKSSLAGPPFRLQISGEARPRGPEPATPAKPDNTAIPEWVARVTGVETGKAEINQPVEDHFVVEGVIR